MTARKIVKHSRAYALLLLTVTMLGACGNATNASCASQLDTIRNQLQWNTPGVDIPQDVKQQIRGAEIALAAGEEAGCLSIVEQLQNLPGIR